MTRLTDEHIESYFRLASEARDNAYAPYSNHPVGAVIVDENDNVYAGCNVELANIRTTCAEANAINQMVLNGGRYIKAVVVVGPSDEYLITPCGSCRQNIREFGDEKTTVYSMWKDGRLGRVQTLNELLPYSFGPENIHALTPDMESGECDTSE